MALSATNGPAAALMASELMARGRKSAAALEALLQEASMTTSAPAQHHGIRELAEQILCCLDRALAALHGDGVVDHEATGVCGPSKKRRSPPGAGAQARPKRRCRAIGAEMPTRVEKWSTTDDGFVWRKYGQKDILNSKYPRTYFRCTYKYDNGCKATRQVQQSDDEPSVYIVTYFGDHTCGMDAAATATVGENKKSAQLVISFGSGSTTSSGSPWVSSSDDNVGSTSTFPEFSEAVCLPKEDGGEQKANVGNTEPSVLAPPAEPSSSAEVSCASLDLDSLIHYFGLDDYCEDGLCDMEFMSFDEAALLQ